MKRGLGKGLSALFDDTNSEYESAGVAKSEVASPTADMQVEIGLVHPNKNQPRKNFDEAGMEELKNSIQMHGVISPIIVNRDDEGYMIIAGERRYRASLACGLQTIPVIVKDYNEKKVAEVALIENLQREDLNVVESARGIGELMQKYNLTQQEISERLGKSRSSIANVLRILQLPNIVVSYIENGRLSFGHGKALCGLDNPELCEMLAREAMDKSLSVRELEKKIQTISKNNISADTYLKKEKKTIAKPDAELLDFQHQLERKFATKVVVDGSQSKGKITIEYFTKDDLDRLYEIILQK